MSKMIFEAKCLPAEMKRAASRARKDLSSASRTVQEYWCVYSQGEAERREVG